MRKLGVSSFVMLCLLISNPAHLSAKKNSKNSADWELARRSDDISIYYRWIENDSLRTREMRAEFSIDASVSDILPHFYNSESYNSWAVGIKECKIEQIDNSNWVTYTLMNYPWPFKQKDLVTRYFAKQDKNETIVSIQSDPYFFDEKEGVERIQNYVGEWRFSDGLSGKTHVDYRVISYTKPVFPRFIQDPVIQNLFINSFHDLKQLVERNEIAKN